MVIVRNNFSTGLDLDSSYYQLRPTSYVSALNISRNAIEGSNDNVITNVVGNRVVTFTLPTGTNKCIGAYAYQLRDAVYFFNYNSNGFHGVYEFILTTRTITKVFENLTDSASVDILGFTENGKINNVNIFPRDTDGDLLNFLDSTGRPTEMNILLFKAGTYTPVTRTIIDVAKRPPLSPPASVYDNDTTTRSNGLTNQLVRFAQFWQYDDYETSTLSPISEMPRPANILDDTFTSVITNNNVVRCSFNSGPKNVKGVGILVSSKLKDENAWSDFKLVEIYDKATNSIADDTTFPYAIYKTEYPNYDEARQVELFDWVPDTALSQTLANGNVLVYFGITEGYTNTVVPNVVNTVSTFAAGGGTTGSLGVVNSLNSNAITTQIMDWTFTGIPATGTIITVTYKRTSDGVIITGSSYTTVSTDTAASVVTNLVANNTAPFVGAAVASSGVMRLTITNSVYQNMANGLKSTVTITAPSTSLAPNSQPCFAWSSQRTIAIEYYDIHGKTNGVVYSAKVTFPAYSDTIANVVNLPLLNTKIYHVPPIWAYSYTFSFTDDPTEFSKFWATVDVNISETDFIYFDVSNFGLNAKKSPTTETVLSYTFQDGDRVRMIKPIGTTTFFGDTYDAAILGLVVEPTISGVLQTGKTFIKIKKTTPFSDATFTPNNHVYEIQIYRPGQIAGGVNEQVFKENGKQYAILNPGTATRVHQGQVTDQSTNYATPAEFNFTEGDYYFRVRTVVLTESSSATFYVQDKNFVDFFTSEVSSFGGRPNIIDPNARTTFYGAMGRFSQAYQYNTNINGLNQFYPNNTYDLDITYGNCLRLVARDRFIRAFQQYKVGRIPLFSEIHKDPQGQFVQAVTDKLLNPVQYDVGDFGIGDQPESLASHDYADYFTTNVKGAICRVSNDGVNNISELYLVDSWATENIPLRTGTSNIYGAFDTRLNKYIIALEAATGSSAVTMTFSEKFKSFESPVSYQPEMMCSLGVTLIGFKNGALYTFDSTTYNNFFGVQYDSYITLLANDSPLAVKSFMAIEEISDTVWTCPEIKSNLFSYAGGTTQQSTNLIESDFEQQENKWDAPILCDENSEGGIIDGSSMKGNYLSVKLMKENPTNLVALNGIIIRITDSPLNTR